MIYSLRYQYVWSAMVPGKLRLPNPLRNVSFVPERAKTHWERGFHVLFVAEKGMFAVQAKISVISAKAVENQVMVYHAAFAEERASNEKCL